MQVPASPVTGSSIFSHPNKCVACAVLGSGHVLLTAGGWLAGKLNRATLKLPSLHRKPRGSLFFLPPPPRRKRTFRAGGMNSYRFLSDTQWAGVKRSSVDQAETPLIRRSQGMIPMQSRQPQPKKPLKPHQQRLGQRLGQRAGSAPEFLTA